MEEFEERSSLVMRRVIAVLSVIGILLMAVLVVQLMKKVKEKKKPEKVAIVAVVDTFTVKLSTYNQPTFVTARLESANRIDLVPEVSGTLQKTATPFRSGVSVAKGQILYRVDHGTAQLDLVAKRSSFLNQIVSIMPDIRIDFPDRVSVWEAYLASLDPKKSLPKLPEPATSQERYFLAARSILTNYYSLKSAEEQVSKYAVTAPFSGVITVATATEGSRVAMGQKIGEFSAGSPFDIRADLPASLVASVKVGDKIALETVQGDQKKRAGSVTRINKQVTPGSQTVVVTIRVNDASLLEGTYVRARFEGVALENVAKVPSRFLYEGNRVALKEQGKEGFTQVEVLSQNDGYAMVLGLRSGMTLVRR